MHQCTIDFLNKNASAVSSPQKKSKLAELNKTWERQRPLIRSRERHLQNLELLPSTPERRPVEPEVVEPVLEASVLASKPSPSKETSQNGVASPQELSSTTPSPSRRRSGHGGSPMERKSPKTRHKQYNRELDELSEWLTSQEAVFHSLVADDTVPSDLAGLETRLQQFQVDYHTLYF